MPRRRTTRAILVTLLLGASPAAADSLSVNQELLEELHREGKISDERYLVLRAEADAEAKALAAASAATSKADWLDRFTLLADLRVRGEAFFEEGVEDRFRERFRARFGVRLSATSEIEAGIRAATGDPGDPISETQTMSELFTKKPISLDKLEVQVIEWAVKEVAAAGDSWVLGGQASGTFAVADAALVTVGLADYNFTTPDRIAEEVNTNSRLNLTNSLVLADGTVVPGGTPFRPPTPPNPVAGFTGGFNVVNPGLGVAIDTGMPAGPISFFTDYAHNTEAGDDQDDAYGFGVSIGATHTVTRLQLGLNYTG